MEMVVEMAEDDASEVVEYSFTVYEIDLDYEFEAARFFDFCREESPLEAGEAEAWFDSAGSYPPSPFVERLVPREEVLMKNVNISPNSKGVDTMNFFESDCDVEADHEISATGVRYLDEQTNSSFRVHVDSQQKFQNGYQKLPPGLTIQHHVMDNVQSENQRKFKVKPTFPRTSTLMKPTASQLAKKNHPSPASSRLHASAMHKPSKTPGSSCTIENQAAKRQKLEGGLPRKVVGIPMLHQLNLVHKEPKQGPFLDGNTTCSKPRITIPKDPDLKTAYRAQRTRVKSSKDEDSTSTVCRFKALPLNRKILEKPSWLPKRSTPSLPVFQEFHLKTSERAMQHSSAILKSLVSQNSCAKEFGIQMEKRFNKSPPIELFNKLSLASEAQPQGNPDVKGSRDITIQGSKENRCRWFQQGYERKHQLSTDERKTEVGAASVMSWNKPIL